MSVKASPNGTSHAAAPAQTQQATNAAPHPSSVEPLIDPLIQSTLLAEAVAAAPYVILVPNEEMQYLAASDAACALLGYSRDELCAMRVPQVCEEQEAPALYQEMLRINRYRGRIVLVCRDGRRIPAYYEAHATRVAGLPYYVSILFPIED
jgi:PAS domain S-box-containing protein